VNEIIGQSEKLEYFLISKKIHRAFLHNFRSFVLYNDEFHLFISTP